MIKNSFCAFTNSQLSTIGVREHKSDVTCFDGRAINWQERDDPQKSHQKVTCG